MTKWDLFPRYKGGFNIRKSKSVIQCVDRTKEKKKKGSCLLRQKKNETKSSRLCD